MSSLERAICIAADAHAGQVDKAGAPYILHPLRVMLRMSTDEQRIVAVLHDVVEDTSWSPQGLRDAGFSEDVVAAVDCLTRRDGENYEEFIRRVATSRLGVKVKLADLEDNADLSRIDSPTDRDRERYQRYRRAIEFLRVVQGVDL